MVGLIGRGLRTGWPEFVRCEFAVVVFVEGAERFGSGVQFRGVDYAIVIGVERSDQGRHRRTRTVAAGTTRRTGSVLSIEVDRRQRESQRHDRQSDFVFHIRAEVNGPNLKEG